MDILSMVTVFVEVMNGWSNLFSGITIFAWCQPWWWGPSVNIPFILVDISLAANKGLLSYSVFINVLKPHMYSLLDFVSIHVQFQCSKEAFKVNKFNLMLYSVTQEILLSTML